MSASTPLPTDTVDQVADELGSLCRRLGLPAEGTREDIRAALDQLAALDPDYVIRLAAGIDLRRAGARPIGTA